MDAKHGALRFLAEISKQRSISEGEPRRKEGVHGGKAEYEVQVAPGLIKRDPVNISSTVHLLLVGALLLGCEKKRNSPPTPAISIQVDATTEEPSLGEVGVANALSIQVSNGQEVSSAKSDFLFAPIVVDREATGYKVGFSSLGMAEIYYPRFEAGKWIVRTKSAFKGDVYAEVLFRKNEKPVRFRILPGEGEINLTDRTNAGATRRD